MYLQGSTVLPLSPITRTSGSCNLTFKKHILGHLCQFSTECGAETPNILVHSYKICKITNFSMLRSFKERNEMTPSKVETPPAISGAF